MSKLTIRAGSQAGMEFPVDRPVVRIGRGSGNEIVLQDTQASRHHAEITQQGDQFYIRDMGSTNGTFVNGERVSGSRLLQPGDQVRVGDTTFGYQAAAAATPAVASDWESNLWQDTGQSAARGRPKWLVWAMVGLIVLLLAAIGVAAALLLRGGEEEAGATAVAEASPQPTAQPVVVAPTATTETAPQAEASATSLVELPTSELLPTVAVNPPAASPMPSGGQTAATVAPAVGQVATTVPAAMQGTPPSGQAQTQALEQLPPEVTQYLGNVPPDQLPDALAAQIQSMPPEQVQEMIGALFPGVSPDKLLPVVAASFPTMSQQEIQGLLNLAFPGQNIQIPEASQIGGRLVLGIYDRAADQHNMFLANASGGQPTQLMSEASEPDFDPAGQWIVYFSWAADHLGLRLVKTDGSGDTQLTTTREHGYPTFSPDGGRISFYHNEEKILHTINRDGSNQRDIGRGEFPAWSPAGDLIAYRGCVGGGKCGLIVANADGSNPRQVTTHADDAAPRWSPNGGQIAFHSNRDGNWEIYVINLDGSWLRRITINPTTDVMPVWSPDGLRVAFRSDRGGKGAVWVTSGIGGGAFKMFDADFDAEWPELAQMDWIK